MTFRVHVRVMPRTGLLDPQGQAVEHALLTANDLRDAMRRVDNFGADGESHEIRTSGVRWGSCIVPFSAQIPTIGFSTRARRRSRLSGLAAS